MAYLRPFWVKEPRQSGTISDENRHLYRVARVKNVLVRTSLVLTASVSIVLLRWLRASEHTWCTSTVACVIRGRQGTSGMHPRVFHYLICISMVKRIQLLAPRSSRTAVIQSLLRRRSVRGKEPPRRCASSVRLSAGHFYRSVWVTGGGPGALDQGTGNLRFSLVSTLLFWVIISQVGTENPTDLIDRHVLSSMISPTQSPKAGKKNVNIDTCY